MALIEKIDSSNLYQMACRMNRGDNFGHKGWNAIGDYLENLSDDLGEDVEIDIIGICCDYNMVESAEEFLQEFPDFLDGQGIDADDWQEWDEQEQLSAIVEYLSDNSSCVAAESDMIIWQAF